MGKESRDAGGPLQGEVAKRTLGWAVLTRESLWGQDLTVSLPGHVQGVIGMTLECGGERRHGLGVNSALSPCPSHKLW